MYVVAIVILLWCTITMWAQRTAIHYDTPSDKLESQAGWLFLSPNLIGFLLFFAGPLIFSLVISFYAWDGITSPTFVGLGNYIETLGLSVASTADGPPRRLRGHPHRALRRDRRERPALLALDQQHRRVPASSPCRSP